MDVLIPGILILHIFSILMWFGSVLIQYVFLSDIIEGNSTDAKRWSMDLIGRINKTTVNIGLTLAMITGVSMILIHGGEWFRPRLYVHLKITLGVIAAALTHIGMARFRKGYRIIQKENLTGEETVQFALLMSKWKSLVMTTLVILATIVIVAIFKFGL
jgi:hypothetical protein